MSIRVDCPCGRVLTYDDSYANVTVECPSCRERLTVPAAGTRTAAEPDDGVRTIPHNAGAKWGSPQGRDEDYEDPREANPYRTRNSERSFVKPPPAPSGGFGSINAGVGGGLAMMAVGALIFFVCLGLGRLSIYGPILFVLGVVALLRGVLRSNE